MSLCPDTELLGKRLLLASTLKRRVLLDVLKPEDEREMALGPISADLRCAAME